MALGAKDDIDRIACGRKGEREAGKIQPRTISNVRDARPRTARWRLLILICHLNQRKGEYGCSASLTDSACSVRTQ